MLTRSAMWGGGRMKTLHSNFLVRQKYLLVDLQSDEWQSKVMQTLFMSTKPHVEIYSLEKSYRGMVHL